MFPQYDKMSGFLMVGGCKPLQKDEKLRFISSRLLSPGSQRVFDNLWKHGICTFNTG